MHVTLPFLCIQTRVVASPFSLSLRPPAARSYLPPCLSSQQLREGGVVRVHEPSRHPRLVAHRDVFFPRTSLWISTPPPVVAPRVPSRATTRYVDPSSSIYPPTLKNCSSITPTHMRSSVAEVATMRIELPSGILDGITQVIAKVPETVHSGAPG